MILVWVAVCILWISVSYRWPCDLVARSATTTNAGLVIILTTMMVLQTV